MGTGSEPETGQIRVKTAAARCLSPFFTVPADGQSEKGGRHRRQTPQPLQNQALDGASPHFRTPVLIL